MFNLKKVSKMLFNEFSQYHFMPKNEGQVVLMEDLKKIRLEFGIPRTEEIVKSIAKTKTKTTYPPDWKFV